MKKEIKWGLLAAGKIAHKFAAALAKVDSNQLHAVAARDAAKAQSFASTYGAMRAYGTYEGLLADPDVDAVYISTVHPFHFEWISRALHAGKHVLCEKPLTMNLREAKQAATTAREKRKLLREAFMYRHHPQTQKIVDLVESGVIGRVRLIDAAFCYNSGVDVESRLQAKSLGGGGILDVGCYTLSFARLIAGRSLGRAFAEPIELKAVGHLDPVTQTDMWTTASLRFEGDVLARCLCAVRMEASNEATIYGETGRIRIEQPWTCDGQVIVEFDDKRAPESYAFEHQCDLYVHEIESFSGELSGRPIGASEAAMRLDDTLGNMKALDWWRTEIGLAYEADRGRMS